MTFEGHVPLFLLKRDTILSRPRIDLFSGPVLGKISGTESAVCDAISTNQDTQRDVISAKAERVLTTEPGHGLLLDFAGCFVLFSRRRAVESGGGREGYKGAEREGEATRQGGTGTCPTPRIARCAIKGRPLETIQRQRNRQREMDR